MSAIVPLRVRDMVGGMDGVGLETYGQFTKLTKGQVEVLLVPPRTCVVIKKDQNKVTLYPTFTIASHHLDMHQRGDVCM
jgi:hypothetical protein